MTTLRHFKKNGFLFKKQAKQILSALTLSTFLLNGIASPAYAINLPTQHYMSIVPAELIASKPAPASSGTTQGLIPWQGHQGGVGDDTQTSAFENLPPDIIAYIVKNYLETQEAGNLAHTSKMIYGIITRFPTVTLDLNTMVARNVFRELLDPLSRASKRLARKTSVVFKYGNVDPAQLKILFQAMPHLSELMLDQGSLKSVFIMINILDALTDDQRKNLKVLALNFGFSFSQQTVHTLSGIFKSITGLKALTLSLRHNILDENKAQLLFGSLATMTGLTELNLNLRGISNKFSFLAQALKPMVGLTVLNLNLSLNNLSDDDIETLYNFLENIKAMEHLKVLTLSLKSNSFGDRSAKALVEAFDTMTNLKALNMNLKLNDIDDATKQELQNFAKEKQAQGFEWNIEF